MCAASHRNDAATVQGKEHGGDGPAKAVPLYEGGRVKSTARQPAFHAPPSVAQWPAMAPRFLALLLVLAVAPTVPAMATATPAAVSDEGKNELLDWSLTIPAEIAAIPALAGKLSADFAAAKAEALAAARADQAQRAKDGFPFNAYQLTHVFEVRGSTPRLISISNDWMSYSGGAHPMHGISAILWDRRAGAAIDPGALVVGGAATLERLFRTAYCQALDSERAEKREGQPAAADPDDPFNACPRFAELAIIPAGPAGGGPMTALMFHADPYVAGPYVEGDYDILLPVTDDFLAALEPAYRSSFALPAAGPPQRQ